MVQNIAKNLIWAVTVLAVAFLIFQSPLTDRFLPAPQPAAQAAAPPAPPQPPAPYQYGQPAPQPGYPQPGYPAAYPPPQAYTPAPAYTQMPQQTAALQPPSVQRLGYKVYEDKKIASQVLDVLNKVKWIATGGGENTRAPIYVLFDPRCPYCHKAYEELNGKAPVRWIPLSVLNPMDQGEGQVAALSKARQQGNSAAAAALDAAFAGRLPSATPDEQSKTTLAENTEAFLALHQPIDPDNAAVPTILVPKPDGGILFHVGWEDGDSVQLLSAYGSAGADAAAVPTAPAAPSTPAATPAPGP